MFVASGGVKNTARKSKSSVLHIIAVVSSTPTMTVAEKMSSLSIAEDSGSGNRGTAKRDALLANEVEVQKLWAEQKAYYADPDATKESFLVTFPYPYSNGHLHIGHGFSVTKAIFRAQFERHRGKNVLFPFAFHCTGMPIQAVRSPAE